MKEKNKRIVKYIKENVKQICLALNVKTDRDILDKLETVDSKNGYIKSLIREDIKREDEDKSEEIT